MFVEIGLYDASSGQRNFVDFMHCAWIGILCRSIVLFTENAKTESYKLTLFYGCVGHVKVVC
jgi:hypothetical protein